MLDFVSSVHAVDLILAIVRFKDQQTEQRNKGGDVVELRRP